MIFDISPPVLYDFGLVSAIDWLLDNVREQHGIRTNLENDGRPKPMEEDIRVTLFQVARELIMNAVKHSEAESLDVSIRRDDGNIVIGIEDDGIGFDTSEIEQLKLKNKGFGLFNIKERLKLLGGKVEIESEPGRGTCVTVAAPLNIGRRERD